MELAEPSIRTAFVKCIEQGANKIICHPYFLSLGRHVQDDIPTLVNDASKACGGINYVITEPIGLHDELLNLIEISINKKLDI